MKCAFCIAGTHSGCGKTTVALGIMAALVRRGLNVQPFKVGPDFIDPGHHNRITGRASHNLDGWMLSPEYNREVFYRYSGDADAAVVEGVMGLFDGFSGSDETGSTAEMAKILDLPIILVIDASSMARSAAAMAMGYINFDPGIPIKGIIFNRVGSKGHERFLREAMACSLPDVTVLGCLPVEEKIEIPSRHLGLVTDEDNPLNEAAIDALAKWIEEGVDLDAILEVTHMVLYCGERYQSEKSSQTEPQVRVGVAMDQAFCFYYEENFRLLTEAGAKIVPFSPLKDNCLPRGVKGLIFGGGYPELYCEKLSENKAMIEEIKEFALSGRPIYAECGGFMFLTTNMQDMEGHTYPMVGIFPMDTIMNRSLRSLGYREIKTREESLLGPPGTTVRGHEFHYSHVSGIPVALKRIYDIQDRTGISKGAEGFMRKRTLGSYIHLHWGSNPDVAKHFLEYCRK